MKQWVLMIMILGWSMSTMALRVELSSDTFSPSGRSANRNLFVTNNSQKMVALEVYAQSRAINPITGIDELGDVEDFLIYPNQLLLQPDEQQVVTLTWVGDQDLKTERAFRIIVEELNLSLDDDEANNDQMTVKLATLTKIIKAAYVAPSGAKPNVVVSASNIMQQDNGKKTIRLTLDNRGTAHQMLKQTELSVTPIDANGVAAAPMQWAPDALNGVLNILANSQRVIDVPWPDGLDTQYQRINVSL